MDITEEKKTQQQPAVSIIISTLNEESYINKLLASLSVQTFKDFEVLVVDGQSVDKTIEVCEEYRQRLSWLTIIRSDYRGISHQRNLGVNQARADLLLFLDADVIFAADFLEKSLNEFNGQKADMATTIGRPISRNLFDKFAFKVLLAVARNLHLMEGWAMLVRRSFHDAINGFDEELFYCEEGDYSLRLTKRGAKYALIKSILYVSVRRFDYEGRLRILGKFARFYFSCLLFGIKASQNKIQWASGVFGGINNRDSDGKISKRSAN